MLHISTIVDSAGTSSTYPTTEVQKGEPADASEEGWAEVESVDSPSSDSGFVSVKSLIPPLIDS